MAAALLAVSSAAALVSASPTIVPHSLYSFDDFVADFGRGYQAGTAEYSKRKESFEERLRSILRHNSDPMQTWKRGVNGFADMTTEEFKQSGRLGYDRRLARQLQAGRKSQEVEKAREAEGVSTALPASWDWRSRGVVSAVKDQGNCGSCWAFGTTETIESHVAVQTGTLVVLSPQQLVSCAPNPLQCGGIGGCQGSVPEVAYSYAQLNGMVTEWMEPYTSYFGTQGACRVNSTRTPAVISITGYNKLPVNDYQAVMSALVKVGPLAINVQADGWSDYHSGVYAGCNNLSNVEIDHVVQLVGYGRDPRLGDYWLVRNSWDATWGENGYIRLARSAKPECGDDIQPLDGTGCAGGPAKQHVCGQCGLLFDVSHPLGGKVVEYGHHHVLHV